MASIKGLDASGGSIAARKDPNKFPVPCEHYVLGVLLDFLTVFFLSKKSFPVKNHAFDEQPVAINLS